MGTSMEPVGIGHPIPISPRHKQKRGGVIMPFGRGFGFRGWSPPWPYVGQGRGGFPRCWAYGGYGPYGDFWDAPSTYPYGLDAYSYGSSPYGWGIPYGFPITFDPYGFGYRSYAQMYPVYPYALNPWGNLYEPPMMTAEGERQWLRNQAESIRQEIDRIKNRISELEKE
jgi:hypothetical protein